MTYDASETGDYSGAPIELYEFRGLDGTAYRYTSSPVDILRGASVFSAATVDRNALRAGTQDGDQHTLTINLPVKTQLVLDYATRISPPKLDLTIYRYHDGEDPVADAIIYWVGPVVSFVLSGDVAKINSTSIFGSALGGNVPSIYFQAPCNWVLFDTQCAVVRSGNEFTDNPTGLSSNQIQVAALPPGFTDVDFANGEISVARTGERRMIIGAVTTLFTINYPFADIQMSDSITITKGCNHSFDACKNKFTNAPRYGGHRFIPYINPFSEGL